MKVIHVITGLADGGAEAVLYRLCTRDQNHRHIVISLMDEGKYGELLRKEGVPVFSLHARRGRLGFVRFIRLCRLIRSQNANIVQTWMYHADLAGGIAARLARVPVVWGIHHSNLQAGKSEYSTILVARLCSLLSRWIPRRIICCSQRAGDVHRNLGYDPRKIIIVPNGYDLTQFFPNQDARLRLRSEWLTNADTPLIGMVARFDPQKDHFNLISALGEVQRRGGNFYCLLVGAGASADNVELMQWIDNENIGNRVILHDRRSDIPDVMNALDLHILSSAYGEAFPNVICEAMACGTPCVATDIGDSALIVGETGWIVPPNDPGALASAIVEALNQRTAAKQWLTRRNACRDRISSHFSIQTMIDYYSAAWSDSSAV